MQYHLLVILLSITKTISGNDYVTFDNKNINSLILSPRQWLISSSSNSSKDICGTSCDSIRNCFTFVYDASKNEQNCFLYSKYFKAGELVTKSNVTLYEKKSKRV
jgi:hypothetical protein